MFAVFISNLQEKYEKEGRIRMNRKAQQPQSPSGRTLADLEQAHAFNRARDFEPFEARAFLFEGCRIILYAF